MAVHNLRDMEFGSDIQPYTKSFDEALREAVEWDVADGARRGKTS
jgi:hypothetical protein